MEIKVRVPKGFVLEKAVCNHGFFMMAPNCWMPSTKTLVRPIRLPDQRSVRVSISQPSTTFLSITAPDEPSLYSNSRVIKDQVKRMLRLSNADKEQLKKFHGLHTDAAKKGFGRLFRNPSLFEDLVKSLLLCRASFKESLELAEGLCVLQKRLNIEKGVVDPAKRGRKKQSFCVEESWGNFPSPQELAIFKNAILLNKKCNLGYRAQYVHELAKNITDGKIRLMDLEKLCDGNELYQKLMPLPGFGDFVSNNALMCMGFYDAIPCDSETVRLIKQVHQREDCDKKNMNVMAMEIYDRYAPFQTLAYWSELVDYYENKVGKLNELDRCLYKNVGGSAIEKTYISN
ncbi:unnamed protein product [Lactuca virosa]|uniref:HhH-GPD domain-containing protein n=1 Tax=Lactuca virosa TaxID=75947 RepID=A0AAU9M065_9ASTR|nr:unnamed protein product [Lactuca virosa]